MQVARADPRSPLTARQALCLLDPSRTASI